MQLPEQKALELDVQEAIFWRSGLQDARPAPRAEADAEHRKRALMQ